MINISIETKGLLDRLNELRNRYLPRALAETLTKTAVEVKASLQHEIRDSFDRPTPYVLNSLYVKPATDKDLVAEVGFKQGAGHPNGHNMGKMLSPHMDGGPRRLKASETAIAQVAAQQQTVSRYRIDMMLSGNNYLAIGGGAAKDRYGNIPRSEYNKILSQLKAFTKEGSDHNETEKSKKRKGGRGPRFFIGSPGAGGKLPWGVWARFTFAFGSAVKPILIAIKSPHYEKGRFDFLLVVKHTFKSRFEPNFRAALERWIGKVK